MARLKYKTQAVNTAIDPAGGFFCRVVNADPVEDDAVFQEVIDALRLTESVFGLKKAVEAVIDTAMRKTAQDGVPRKVGGLFRTFITIKGKVPNGDSPFTALAGHGCGAYVRWGLSSEVTREVDYNSVSISNVQGAQSVAVGSIAYNGAEENAFDIRTGTPILVTGRNLAFIDGDSVTVSRTVDGAEAILASLVPGESDYYHESFAWPSGLDGLEAGAEVKFTFRLRGGDPEATPVVVSKAVTVNAGATPPAPDPAVVTLASMVTEGMLDNNIRSGTEPITLEGENLTLGEGDKLYMKLTDDLDERYVEVPSAYVKRNTSAAIDLGDDVNDPIWAWIGENCQPTEEHDRITVKLVSHGGVPSSEPQTVTATAVVQFA